MRNFFEKQKKLDDVIVGNLSKRVGVNIGHRQLIDKRMLAVTVELGEFIKEKDHDKKLMEWVDCFHFLLSCGLALNISEHIAKHDINTLYEQAMENMYEAAILNFVVKFSDFCNSVQSFKYWKVNRVPKPNVEKLYSKCFLAFFDLAKTMGYTVADIRQAYSEKWSINIERQKNGY